MNERTCSWIRDQLPEHAGAELAPGRREDVEGHLAHCGGCRAEAELLLELRNVRPVPGEALRGRVRKGVLAGEPSPAAAGRGRRSRTFPRSVAAMGGVAAASVAALGAFWLLAVEEPGTDELAGGPDDTELMVGDLPDEWVVAGEPVFSELPEEALEHLLSEMNE